MSQSSASNMEARPLQGPVSELRKRRLAAGVSQERVARGAECSVNTVRIAEKGFGSKAMLARIEKALAEAISDEEVVPNE